MLLWAMPPVFAKGAVYVKMDTWSQTMLAAREGLKGSGASGGDLSKLQVQARQKMMDDFPVQSDWALQDLGNDLRPWFDSGEETDVEAQMIGRVLGEIGAGGKGLEGELDRLKRAKVSGKDKRWLELYVKACELRREIRLAGLIAKRQKIVFTKHYILGGSHYAYTEGQSDAQRERHFSPGTSLCILEMDSIYGNVEVLIDDPKGVIRDPAVSYDGRRILFSWKKSDREDDYHLYEMDAKSRKITQITDGLGFADYEGEYLPNGDIIFNSTRCVQIVDCWWTEVSNLYTVRRDGCFLRRLSFDQVHTNFPTILEDGTVIYTRWDYNDRGQLYPQPLYQMNPDGTGQREFYGNNSWFPTTIMHARGIPGTNKVLAVASGHHTRQTGKLIIIDPAKGRQENGGIQLVAPVRETRAEKIDKYGQGGELWQYPYSLSESEYLVTYSPFGWDQKPVLFNIYYMTIDGKRELLAADPKVSCNQTIPLSARPRPHLRPSMVDYTEGTGTYYVHDIYVGQSPKGIERGTIKKLRVIELRFRAAGVGSNRNGGPAGGALVSTPISIDNGTWDVKVVVGDAKVYEDGSACFEVPARMPVYFQALDAKGHAVQSMRTWSTLQPGENFACVGCHETKNEAPDAITKPSMAMKAGPQKLSPFYGPPRGFSFIKEIQPILDRHCIRCHNDRMKNTSRYIQQSVQQTLDIKAARPVFARQSQWHYTFEKPRKGWQEEIEYDLTSWKSGKGGFGTEGTPGAKIGTEWNTKDIWLRRTFDLDRELKGRKLAFDIHHDEDVQIYINGIRVARMKDRLKDYERLILTDQFLKALKPGTNVIALQCLQTEGGQYIDLGLYDFTEARPAGGTTPKEPAAFSLLGVQNPDNKAGRKWSDAYLTLTQDGRAGNEIVNWLNVQSIPPLLPPYFAGSAKSKLITMLEDGHNETKLSRQEMDKIACWIDLLVPYCGSYTEANCWTEDQIKMYQRYQDKRDTMAAKEWHNTQVMIGGSRLMPQTYRNVALNPKDAPGPARSFPHASSNSEYKDMPAFVACNAINGKKSNTGHGGRYPSWGPHKRTDLWWKVDFANPVEVDKVTLYIRADFPHDDYWHNATIEFSDGSRESITLKKTPDAQEFTFEKRIVSWLRFTDLVEAEPLGWCGFTEVEVWGRDAEAENPGSTIGAVGAAGATQY